MPVNRAEERIGLVVLAKRLARPLASLTERRSDRQTKRGLNLRNSACGKEVHITTEIGSELEVVFDRHFFIEVETADHPVDIAVARRRQAELLGEGFDVGGVGVTPDQVSAREVRVGVLGEVRGPECRDRGERCKTGIIVALQRDTGVFDLVLGAEVIGNAVRERCAGNNLTAKGVDHGAGRAIHEVHGGAAGFVDRVVVSDQAEAQVFVWFEQQFAAQAIAVALVGVRTVGNVFDIAVANVVVAAQAESERLADRGGVVAADAVAVEVADRAFDVAFRFEGRLLGDDRDDARRCVLAEQGRLRSAQDFDALDVRKVRNLRRRTRPVDAVDEHANRRLDTGIVRAVAEAANDEVGVGRRLQLANAQRRNDRLKVIQVNDFGFFNHVFADNGHGDRNVLQRLLTLGGSDRDGLQRAGFFFGFFLCEGRCRERCQRGNAHAEAKNSLKPAFAGFVGIVREHSEFPSWEFDLKR